MSLHDYIKSKQIAIEDYPFYALIMAAMRQADSDNILKLRLAWPEVYNEFRERYNLPGGVYPRERHEYPEYLEYYKDKDIEEYYKDEDIK